MSKSFAEILRASLGFAASSAILHWHQGGHTHGSVSHLHRVEGSHGHSVALRLLLHSSSSPLCSGSSLGCGSPLGFFTSLLGSLSLGLFLLLNLLSTGSSSLLSGNFPSLSSLSLSLSSFFSLFLKSSSLLSLGNHLLSLPGSGCESSLSQNFSFVCCGSLPLCNNSCSFLGGSCFLGSNLSCTTLSSSSFSGGCSSTCLCSGSSCCHVLSVPSPEHQSSSGCSKHRLSSPSGGSGASGGKNSLVSSTSPGSSSSLSCLTSGDHPSVGECSLSSEGKHSSVSSSTSHESDTAGVGSTSSLEDSLSFESGHSATMSKESCPSNPNST